MPDLPMLEIERVFRVEYGRAVAVLVRHFRDIDVAEEAVQDAFTAAVELWPRTGVPPSPAGWIVTTARNRAIDRMRREATLDERHEHAARFGMPSSSTFLFESSERAADGAVQDDRLRLIFTCCHPALEASARVALTLRLLGGLTTKQIARAFLVPEATMAQRLVRAKGKIRDAGIPYRVPLAAELPARLDAVLSVVYLIFTAGHSSTSDERLVREDLCTEALRLATLLSDLVPNEPEVMGLLALLLLVESRRTTRTTRDGALVRLADQDRSRWDRDLIAKGHAIVRDCLRLDRPGPYQIQAAIQAVHCDAPIAAKTDFKQIVALYDQLILIAPSPIVALHRAVAVAEIDGAGRALEIVDSIELDELHLFHAIRADLLRRLGRDPEAVRAYDAAIARCDNPTEREFLELRRSAVARPS